jgi:4-amino-4-deoxy-L-arabinose transferase-like glycosyltransferase
MSRDALLPTATSLPAAGAPASATRAELARLGIVLLAGLVVRLVLLWRFAGVGLAIHDERDYDQLAVSIVERGEFGFEPGQLTSLCPPLYPAFLAGVYSVFGVQNYQAVRAMQIVLSLATTSLLYLLARRLYEQRVALAAAAIHCLYPSLVGATNLVLTETLFTLLVCAFLVLVERFFATQSPLTVAAAGIVLGLAALTRSVVWLFPPFAFVLLVAFSPQPTFLRRVAASLPLVVGFALTLAPWTIRNTRLQETFITVDVMGGRNVMMGNYEFTPAYRPWAAIEITGEEAWHSVLSKEIGGLAGKTQGQIDKLAMKYAFSYMLAHPGQTLSRSVAKLFHFWQLERELVADAKQGIWGAFSTPLVVALAAIVMGAYAATMLLGIFGAVLSPPRSLAMHALLLVLVAFVTALHCVAFAHSRYHLPLMPIVILYAAAAWVGRRGVLIQWRSWKFAAAAAIGLVLAASWVADVAFEAGRF